MRQTLITLTGLALAGLVAAPAATAQARHRGEGGAGRHHGMARALDLTEEQRATAREIFEQQRPEREALRAEMQENRSALDEALESEQPDALLVGELMIESKALRARGRALREQSKHALEGVLTEEQKQKLELLEDMRPRGRRGKAGREGLGRRGPGAGPAPE